MTDDRILVKVEGPGVNVEGDVPVDVGLRILGLLLIARAMILML